MSRHYGCQFSEEDLDRGYRIIVGGSPYEGVHATKMMKEEIKDRHWRIAFNPFSDETRAPFDYVLREGKTVSPQELGDILNDENTWCVRQIRSVNPQKDGLVIEHGMDGVYYAFPLDRDVLRELASEMEH